MNNTEAKPETWEEKHAREKQEERDAIAASMKKMREVAKVMKYTITEEAGKGRYKENIGYRAFITMTGPDGVVLSLNGEGWRQKSRISICGDYPKDKRGQDSRACAVGYGKTTPSITVSVDRTAEQIAKAITSRLMPEYLPTLKKAQELVKSWDESQSTKESAFKAVTGREAQTDQERDGKTRMEIGKLDKSQEYDTDADIYISYSGVKLTIDNLPPIMARSVLDFLKAHALKGKK